MPGHIGGIAYFFDSSKMDKSHRWAQKKHGDGYEAPRNSLDISSASRGYHSVTGDVQVKARFSEVNHRRNGTSMKRLIDGETCRQTSDSSVGPSVVARLMGMDSIPEQSLKVHTKEHEIYRSRRSMEISKATVISSGTQNPCSSTPSRESKDSLLVNSKGRHSKAESRGKPQRRQHPQEEQLKKFKVEFEAWQASKDYRTLAQEILNREKMAKYLDTKNKMTKKNPTGLIDVASPGKQIIDTKEETTLSFSNSSMPMKLTTEEDSIDCFRVTETDRKQERTSSATRIVILKPSFDRIDGDEEKLAALSDQLGKDCSMEDFLEEVKQRLRTEVQGRSSNNFVCRGNVVRTSFDESSMNPKQITHDIAKQIRESVSRDMGMNLMRSNSTRTVRSDTQISPVDSPEFIGRDMRKFLSQKSKNVLKNELLLENPSTNHGDSGASSNKGKEIPKLISDFSDKAKNVDYWKNSKVNESDPIPTQKFLTINSDSEPQRNLIRSFSAPMSGTAFGKLFLEDQHIASAQFHRKHEPSDNNFSESRKQRKDSFNLKGTVANLKHNLNLKGMLFRRKNQPIKESTPGQFISVDKPAAPTMVTNFGMAQDNATDVPPSPASVSRSSEEFCRQDNPSPISPLEVMAYHTSPCISEELSSNAPGREPDLSENLEHGGAETAVSEQPQKQEITDMENKDVSPLRGILATAGFYDSKLDELSRPISYQDFEVEEAYSKYGKVDTDSSIPRNDDVTIRHKLLFDLVNESMQSLLGPTIKCSMFKRWILGPTSSSQGKRLLEDLWNQIQLLLNSSIDGSSNALDSMVAQDLKMTTWPTMSYEDMDVVGRQIERVILLNLIDDIVRDLCLWHH
ncbi:uncharacterized protein LOC141820144 [Curcuma longa]|uniref:uncharacterized protein LOC141820144 n=1 Tax=Curcuma longa TaxID=136217 RepID=UPI003D9F96D7